MDRIIGKDDKYITTAVIVPIVSLDGEKQMLFAVDAFIGELTLDTLDEVRSNEREVESVFSIPIAWFKLHEPEVRDLLKSPEQARRTV